MNVTLLLKYHGHRANSPISSDLFTYLCPALLYQIDSRLCIEHFDKLLVEDLNKDKNQVPEDKANIGASGKKDLSSFSSKESLYFFKKYSWNQKAVPNDCLIFVSFSIF